MLFMHSGEDFLPFVESIEYPTAAFKNDVYSSTELNHSAHLPHTEKLTAGSVTASSLPASPLNHTSQVVAIECCISWNSIYGINNIASEGQLIPLILGLVSLLQGIGQLLIGIDHKIHTARSE